MSRLTVWLSKYSDISKRISSTPKHFASCLQTSVFPTPVAPANKKDPIGLSSLPNPERDNRIADVNFSIAGS